MPSVREPAPFKSKLQIWSK